MLTGKRSYYVKLDNDDMMGWVGWGEGVREGTEEEGVRGGGKVTRGS